MNSLQQLLSGELVGSKQLKLSCGLTEFPKEIFSLSETLEILDLSGNQLSVLPADFARLSKLKIVFFSDNLFTELPSVLSECKQLSMIGFKANQIKHVPDNSLPSSTRWLILTNNQITKLPSSIGNCLPLQKCALAGNCLTSLPVEMANCTNLELLRISANKLTELPEWLLQLPKLSWLAFSGNPFSHKPPTIKKLRTMRWEEFQIHELLGEGASGHIYKATWYTETLEKLVAIKVFKGEVTSDGFPEDEMQASVTAGIHPNLVVLLGEVKNHPSKKHALVMELISPSYYNLGFPPNYETCSRDTFMEGTTFSLTQILRIFAAVVSTSKHLHGVGLNHGDLYAHNILITDIADTLLSDFGAASFYNKECKNSEAIEKIEVRALGCLLEDLLRHTTSFEMEEEQFRVLTKLKDEMMQAFVHKRPSLIEIEKQLFKIEAIKKTLRK